MEEREAWKAWQQEVRKALEEAFESLFRAAEALQEAMEEVKPPKEVVEEVMEGLGPLPYGFILDFNTSPVSVKVNRVDDHFCRGGRYVAQIALGRVGYHPKAVAELIQALLEREGELYRAAEEVFRVGLSWLEAHPEEVSLVRRVAVQAGLKEI